MPTLCVLLAPLFANPVVCAPMQVIDSETSIRDIYSKYLPLYLYRILGSNVSRYFSPDEFKMKN